MPNILDTIVAQKHREIARLQPVEVTPDLLAHHLAQRPHPLRDFFAALHTTPPSRVALIAEVKKASPSAGLIRPDFDPVAIARRYHAAGADCLSVLTDEHFFQGRLEYLAAIRQTVPIPLLRKDFILDPRQILQAVQAGADAILLIVAILDDQRLQQLHTLATAGGLTVLVEVHDEAELDRALALQPRLIGVNNRNLKTFAVDLATTERLATRLAADLAAGRLLLVAESGIHTRRDVERLQACGARAILVGESLMRQPDLEAKVRELLEA